MRPLVIYHGSCADGFTAAWIAHSRLGNDADYIAANYGESPPDVTGREVYILDFSYKRPVLEEMSRNAKSILVLDHHKTAEADLRAIGADPISGFLAGGNTLLCIFDMEKSGGHLAWDHFKYGYRIPWIVRYTEDRDLWLWKLPKSKEISAALASYPRTFEQWDHFYFHVADDELMYSPTGPGTLPVGPLNDLAKEGAGILRYQQQQVESAVQNAREIELDGHKVLSLNSTTLISEIAGKLAEGRPFGATWFERPDGTRVWSLRSREGGIDVSEVAKKRGGGGHRNAAGFEVKP